MDSINKYKYLSFCIHNVDRHIIYIHIKFNQFDTSYSTIVEIIWIRLKYSNMPIQFHFEYMRARQV